jgi:hypothetical protein
MRFSVVLALGACLTCAGCAQLDEPSEQAPDEAQRSGAVPSERAAVAEQVGAAASSFLWWAPPPPPPSFADEATDEMIVDADGAREVPR